MPKPFNKFIAIQSNGGDVLTIPVQHDIPAPLDLKRETRGFVNVADGVSFVQNGANLRMFHFKIKTRILPDDVLKKAIDKEVKRVAGNDMFSLSNDEMRTLSEGVELELLRNSHVQEKIIRVAIFSREGFDRSDIILVETTSPSIIDTIRLTLYMVLGSTHFDLDFGAAVLDIACNNIASIEGLYADGNCVWDAILKEDKRTVTLTNFDLSAAMLNYWVSEGFWLRKLNLILADSIDHGEYVERTSARFCLSRTSVFSSVKFSSDFTVKSRDLNYVEQMNLAYMHTHVLTLLTSLRHPFMVGEV